MDKQILQEKTQKFLTIKNDQCHQADVALMIDELRDVLKQHNELYYIYASPIISDSQYDTLFTLLTKWEEQFPDLITFDSPTQQLRIGLQV